MSGEMSRGEMIRRLDEVSKQGHDLLENGPLTAEERHALAASLEGLLPVVADSLQDQEDRQAAHALQPQPRRLSNAKVERVHNPAALRVPRSSARSGGDGP